MNILRRPIVFGNWKLNGTISSTSALLQALTRGWNGVHNAEVVACPAQVHLSLAYNALAHSNIVLGAQDVSEFAGGAYTGDVCADMLHDLGCIYTLVGHSERRRYHQETNAQVARKFEQAQLARLIPVLCIGESLQERQQGLALQAIGKQLQAVINHCGLDMLAKAVIAYEPIWAVGTGITAAPHQAQEVHAFIRSLLGVAGQQTRIVYGGSVKANNAAELFAQPDIDGALVGGASLDANEFLAICQAAE